MTREQKINLAIALSQGWIHHPHNGHTGVSEHASLRVEGQPFRIMAFACDGWNGMPDYCGDLNAIHKLVIALPKYLRDEWLDNLDIVCGSELALSDMLSGTDFGFSLSNATAAHRAEAYAVTMNLPIK